MENHASAIEKILDGNNSENVVLYNENGKPIELSQVALIPIEHKLYAILTMVAPLDGVEENEGLVFSIESDEDGKECLMLISDNEIIDTVFSVYDALCEEDTEGERDE